MEIKPVKLWFEGGITKEFEGTYFKVEVDGREIELAVHESPYCSLTYDVTDPATGFSILRNFLTIEGAIAESTKKIRDKGADGYDAAVKKALDFLAANCITEQPQ